MFWMSVSSVCCLKIEEELPVFHRVWFWCDMFVLAWKQSITDLDTDYHNWSSKACGLRLFPWLNRHNFYTVQYGSSAALRLWPSSREKVNAEGEAQFFVVATMTSNCSTMQCWPESQTCCHYVARGDNRGAERSETVKGFPQDESYSSYRMWTHPSLHNMTLLSHSWLCRNSRLWSSFYDTTGWSCQLSLTTTRGSSLSGLNRGWKKILLCRTVMFYNPQSRNIHFRMI